jgi:hypothetical protein
LEGQSKAYPTGRRALIANPTADDREDSPELPDDTHFTDEVPPTLDAFALPEIPRVGLGGIPLLSELELELPGIRPPTERGRSVTVTADRNLHLKAIQVDNRTVTRLKPEE